MPSDDEGASKRRLSKYVRVNAIAERAKQLLHGRRATINSSSTNAVSLALEEFEQGKLEIVPVAEKRPAEEELFPVELKPGETDLPQP